MIPYVSHNLRAQHAPSPYIKHKIHTFARDSSWWDKPPERSDLDKKGFEQHIRLKRPKCPKLAISKGPLSSIAGPQWLPEGVVLHMLSRKCWTCWTVWATWSVSLHSEEGQHSSQHLTPTLPSYLLIQKSLAWEMHFYLRRLLLQTTSGWVARLKKTPFKGKAEEGPI